MTDRLREHGLRLTPQRLALLRILDSQGKHHPSFSDVCEAMSTKHLCVSQSTVLKNLDLFEELGIVRSFSFQGETHYEMNPAPHVNVVDTNGRMVDVEDEEIRQILDDLIEATKKRTGIETGKLLVILESGEGQRN